MDFDSVFKLLNENKFKVKKISGKQVAIYTSNNRIEMFHRLETIIPDAVYDETPLPKSALGSIQIGNIKILVKPLRLGDETPDKRGIDNEHLLYNEIHYHTNPRPINVLFKSEDAQYPILNCVGAELVGSNTADSKKTDIVLTDTSGVQHCFSLKQDNSDFWASCDTYFGEEAEALIEIGAKKNLIDLKFHDPYYSITPSIITSTTQQEKEQIIFGSDIHNGAVIVRSFEPSDFQRIDRWLVINTTDIIMDIDDLNDRNDVVFLIRNDRTRKGIKNYPGLRSTAIPRKRISKNMINIERI